MERVRENSVINTAPIESIFASLSIDMCTTHISFSFGKVVTYRIKTRNAFGIESSGLSLQL